MEEVVRMKKIDHLKMLSAMLAVTMMFGVCSCSKKPESKGVVKADAYSKPELGVISGETDTTTEETTESTVESTTESVTETSDPTNTESGNVEVDGLSGMLLSLIGKDHETAAAIIEEYFDVELTVEEGYDEDITDDTVIYRYETDIVVDGINFGEVILMVNEDDVVCGINLDMVDLNSDGTGTISNEEYMVLYGDLCNHFESEMGAAIYTDPLDSEDDLFASSNYYAAGSSITVFFTVIESEYYSYHSISISCAG